MYWLSRTYIFNSPGSIIAQHLSRQDMGRSLDISGDSPSHNEQSSTLISYWLEGLCSVVEILNICHSSGICGMAWVHLMRCMNSWWTTLQIFSIRRPSRLIWLNRHLEWSYREQSEYERRWWTPLGQLQRIDLATHQPSWLNPFFQDLVSRVWGCSIQVT